jgi:hypothetical protein
MPTLAEGMWESSSTGEGRSVFGIYVAVSACNCFGNRASETGSELETKESENRFKVT